MFEWWQILLLTLYAAYQIMDDLHWFSGMSSAVFSGMITGLIMGDVMVGLYIGGCMQLTILGVGTFGGASRIDANSGALIATAFAIGAGMDPEQALASIGVSVAAILVYTDIAARFANTFISHLCERDVDKMDWRAFTFHHWLGAASWMLSRALPVFLALTFGQGLVETVTELLNGELAWLGTGLTVAGASLPAVGFAILLRNLPVKEHVAYLILGFATAALFGTAFSDIALVAAGAEVAGSFQNLSMLAIALIGFALALLHYKNGHVAPAEHVEGAVATAALEGDDEDEL